MNGEPRTDTATDPSECRHEMRLRENLLGFASPETVCVNCGQIFDTDEEQDLRHRDQTAQPVTTRLTFGEGYIVG